MGQVLTLQSGEGDLIRDENHNVILGIRQSVPADAEVGYAPGGIIMVAAGTVGAARYINEGSSSSCAFKAMPIINTTQAFIPLPFTSWREVISNDIGNIANNGGVLATDSTPTLEYSNGDTDSQIRVLWAAGNADPIATAFPLPPDMDRTADMVLHFYGEMGGATDTPVVDMDTFFNTADTKVEDSSSALADAVAENTITVAAADIPSDALVCSIELTPGAHATDNLAMYAGCWIEYTRKTLTA